MNISSPQMTREDFHVGVICVLLTVFALLTLFLMLQTCFSRRKVDKLESKVETHRKLLNLLIEKVTS